MCDCQEVVKKADDNWDKYVRQVAENSNLKKRQKKEMDAFKKFANDALLTDILVTADNLRMALDNMENVKTQGEGIQLTLRELEITLEKYGVERIDSLGKQFDPNFMKAIDTVETEMHQEGHVMMVLQEGYILHGRLLRPASVVVTS